MPNFAIFTFSDRFTFSSDDSVRTFEVVFMVSTDIVTISRSIEVIKVDRGQ